MRGNLDEMLRDIPPEVARGVARYGVKIAIDLLQTLFRDLGGADGETKGERKATARLARQIRKQTAKYGWSDDPAERKREMKRRMAKRGRPPAKLHPRDSRHPEHAAWLAKMRKANKAAWSKLSPAQKTARVNVMVRGRQQHDKTEAKVA